MECLTLFSLAASGTLVLSASAGGGSSAAVNCLIALSGMTPVLVPMNHLKPLVDVIDVLVKYGFIAPLGSAALALLPAPAATTATSATD